MTAPDAITRDELAEALRGLKITPEDENTFYPAVADAIFEKVRRNREPEYEPGDIVQAHNYQRYYRTDDVGWIAIPGGLRCPDGFPKRPLRKLIAQPARDQVEAALTEDGTDLWHETLLRTYVDRIMRLLEGEQ